MRIIISLAKKMNVDTDSLGGVCSGTSWDFVRFITCAFGEEEDGKIIER